VQNRPPLQASSAYGALVSWPTGADVCARTLDRQGILDAIDGTPVLDIKPVFEEYLPKGTVVQPQWSHEIMRDYWEDAL
jgi:tRNA (Thr-GGU) A37 N-methylase